MVKHSGRDPVPQPRSKEPAPITAVSADPSAALPASHGRRTTLTRTAIADAALAVGFEGLTVTAVAERLGVTHAALYRHVADRDELLIAAVDRLAEGVDWPAPEPSWHDYLEACAWVLWDVFTAHPGLSEVMSAGRIAPPKVAELFAKVCDHLYSLGFAPDDAVLATDVVLDLPADVAPRSAERLSTEPDELARQSSGWESRLDPRLRSAFAMAFADPTDWFARKLAVVLDGVEASLAPTNR